VALEKTLIIVKPDGVQRRLIGEVLGRFERKGMRIAAMKLMRITGELADQHYAEHVSKPFYPGLREFITSGPAVVFVAEGKNAITVGRTLVGSTDAGAAAPGTIRGDLGLSKSHNVVHASDGPDAASREISLYFDASEVVEAESCDQAWVYDLGEDLGK
jgi:nucleoside-diphosphate kinase